jgi:glyoxylase-like metal-dependent hydrolase (beta-lactamase superfamily II)
VRLPDRTVRSGQTLHLGGLTIHTAEFGPGEAKSQTLYFLPASGTLFAGDVVSNEVTPALIERHSRGWLRDLKRLQRRFPRADLAYPGHGNVDTVAALIRYQQRYLERFRRLVSRRVAAASDQGRKITGAERRAVVAATERRYPGFLPVAATIPDLLAENVDFVADELRAQRRRRSSGRLM